MKWLWFVLFVLSLANIFWAMIGYNLSIRIIYMFRKKRKDISLDFFPSLTIMIVAHNEEKSILSKLKNSVSLEYPIPFAIIVTSDNSTDKTNQIVEEFIAKNKDKDIILHKTKKRAGKTNAQNEAQKLVKSEILVMTDANSILDEQALIYLVQGFKKENIFYVTGKLEYVNDLKNITSKSESRYWNRELNLRKMESNIKTITAGNGAIYACRNEEYIDFDPIFSHDSKMPLYYNLKKKKSIYIEEAVAYEKAGENTSDEFSRKIRMNRDIVSSILPTISILNVFKHGWFTYFYLGHRTSRYLLWLSHFILLISNIFLSIYYGLFLYVLIVHLLFYLLSLLGRKIKFIIFSLPYYYVITILAQIIAVKRTIFKQNKPFWEKAESTR